MFTRLAPIFAVATLAALSAPAFAWQEQPATAHEPATGPNPSIAPNLSLSVPDVDQRRDSGTEVRVPGIGTIGVLPKLDFGFELLYGPNDPGARPDDRSQPSDVQLRGTLKDRF